LTALGFLALVIRVDMARSSEHVQRLLQRLERSSNRAWKSSRQRHTSFN
jgi:hypothetical protein